MKTGCGKKKKDISVSQIKISDKKPVMRVILTSFENLFLHRTISKSLVVCCRHLQFACNTKALLGGNKLSGQAGKYIF